MIAAVPAIQFQFITADIDRVLDELVSGGAIVAYIYNDAQSPDGTYYWRFVNDGRGPVFPIKAKVLHWVDPQSGKDVYARFSRGVAPRHMRENAVAAIRGRYLEGPTGDISRELLIEYVNNLAQLAVEEMVSRTPFKTGQLQSKYRIEPTE